MNVLSEFPVSIIFGSFGLKAGHIAVVKKIQSQPPPRGYDKINCVSCACPCVLLIKSAVSAMLKCYFLVVSLVILL